MHLHTATRLTTNKPADYLHRRLRGDARGARNRGRRLAGVGGERAAACGLPIGTFGAASRAGAPGGGAGQQGIPGRERADAGGRCGVRNAAAADHDATNGVPAHARSRSLAFC